VRHSCVAPPQQPDECAGFVLASQPIPGVGLKWQERHRHARAIRVCVSDPDADALADAHDPAPVEGRAL